MPQFRSYNMTRRIVVWSLAFLAAVPLLAQGGPSPAQVAPLTGEVSVAVSPEPYHYGLHAPDVAVSGPQEFLVSWDVSYQRYNGSQLVDWGAAISGRKVSFEGQPIGEELVLEPFERRTYQGSHSLAANASGRFAVLWDEFEEPSGLYLRRFTPGGSPLDTRRLDDAESAGSYPGVKPLAMDPSGRMAAAWTTPEAPGISFPSDVWVQIFDASGEPETDRPLLGDLDGDGSADLCLARGEDLFCDPDRDGVLTQETLATQPGDVLLLGNVDGV
jgi:hypothetical protein